MKLEPLVSIITPSFNPGVRRFRRCVESVRKQTYVNVEHIVIDGGSTDGVQEALRTYDRLAWVSEPDGGQTDAINKGFAMAKGQILGWLNADDVLTSSAIEKVVGAFQKDQSVDWTIGDVVVVADGHGELEKPARVDRPQTWSTRNIAAQPGSFLSRAAVDRVGPLDQSLHYMMDLDLWLRLIDSGLQHAYIDEVLAVFEVHEDSKSGSVSHATFLLDDARARLKSGRTRQAAFSLGRAAAWALSDQTASFEDAVAWARDAAEGDSYLVDDEGFCSAVDLEMWILRVKSDLSALPNLLRPRYLHSPEARARLRHVMARVATQRRRREVGGRYASMVL